MIKAGRRSGAQMAPIKATAPDNVAVDGGGGSLMQAIPGGSFPQTSQ